MNYRLIIVEYEEEEIHPADPEAQETPERIKRSVLNSQKAAKGWLVSGSYPELLSGSPPLYDKDGKKYAIHCIVDDRFVNSVEHLKKTIDDEGLTSLVVVTPDPSGWLESRDYLLPADET